ncbi:hypothetical protein GCM10020000_06460 [Streptomyces olivoverticillatus]
MPPLVEVAVDTVPIWNVRGARNELLTIGTSLYVGTFRLGADGGGRGGEALLGEDELGDVGPHAGRHHEHVVAADGHGGVGLDDVHQLVEVLQREVAVDVLGVDERVAAGARAPVGHEVVQARVDRVLAVGGGAVVAPDRVALHGPHQGLDGAVDLELTQVSDEIPGDGLGEAGDGSDGLQEPDVVDGLLVGAVADRAGAAVDDAARRRGGRCAG